MVDSRTSKEDLIYYIVYMTGISKEEHYINVTQQILKSIFQENFPEEKKKI